MNILEEGQATLNKLGEQLKTARKIRSETQAEFSQQLGLTRQTYSKMEKGDSNISIGYWIKASQILDKLSGWSSVFEEKKISQPTTPVARQAYPRVIVRRTYVQ